MVVFILLNFLVSDFQQKWFIPKGMIGECGRLLVSDTDRDGNHEFYIHTYGGSQKIYIYELHLPDTWEVDSFPCLYSPLIWDTGDFDVDGLADIVIEASATQGYPTMVISIAESPDSFSYPTQEVWRDTVGSALVTPICAYDIDQDGVPEIVKVLGDYIHLHIYETIGNNIYDKIAEITTSSTHNSSSTLAFGDFDSDNQNEFVWGYSAGEYSIWECTGNNSYQEILLQQLPTVNIKDCFSVADADGDGKMEFVVKGFWVYGTIDAFIFEATGDNTYEIIKTFNFPGGDYYGGYSEAGDVDGDSVPEIVLESASYVYIIKAAGNDSFYVWDTLPGNSGGSSIAVYDIDENGLAEIVISGNNQTRIYEYDAGGIEEAQDKTHVARLEVYPNPIHKKCNIKYVLPQYSNVNVSLFDVAGRLIKEIINEKQIGGIYYKTFDMTDLPQGIYFFRLETRDYKETRKAILLK